MKKTITINIAGLVFNIEENAYSILKEYLGKIGNKFNNLEERQEITEDIEARIAELFTEKLNRNKEVVNENDVENIISIMGSPESFEGDDTEYEEKETNTESKSSTTNQKKKLFRDPDNKVVAGICAGISTYFDWNISIVRTVFALLILFGGTGFWLYIIAWIIIPEAKSTSEKLAMKGKNATVENIEKYITKFRTEVKNLDTKNVSDSFKKQSNKFNDFLVGTSQRINNTLKPKENVGNLIRAILSFIGFILISIGLVIILSIIYGTFVNPDLFQDTEFMVNLDSNFHVLGENFSIIFYAFIFFVISMAIGLVITGIKLAFYQNKELISKIKPASKIIRFSSILCLITLIAFLILNKMSFTSFSYSHKEEINYKTIIINKVKLENRFEGNSKLDFKIEKINYDIPYLRISTKGQGFKTYYYDGNSKDDFIINDSIIELPEYINFSNTHFVNKKVKIILFVPENDSVKIINNFNDAQPE